MLSLTKHCDLKRKGLSDILLTFQTGLFELLLLGYISFFNTFEVGHVLQKNSF